MGTTACCTGGHRCVAISFFPSPAAAADPAVPSVVQDLKPLLPAAAFRAAPDRLALVLINLAILALGFGMACRLDHWPTAWLPAFLPFAVAMGNSIIVLLFATHDLLHAHGLSGPFQRRLVGMLGLSLLGMPPSLWVAVHNREHHGHTNGLTDPDRSYLEGQQRTWGKWIQHQFVPSNTVTPFGLLVGMGGAWPVHNLRTLGAVLLPHRRTCALPPASFGLSRQQRWRVALELIAIVAVHLSLIALLAPSPLKLVLGYGLPLWIGYGGAMAYIYTNHLLCPLTAINDDPLVNTMSLLVPPWLDRLHLNFSHHVEHHLFPGLNSDYYPLLRQLLIARHGERYQLLPAGKAWRLLLSTPRHYRDSHTLVGWDGEDGTTISANHHS